MSLDDFPPTIRDWVAQLLDPRTVKLVEAAGEEPLSVRLYAARGKVRKRPSITVGDGPSEMVAAGEIASVS